MDTISVGDTILVEPGTYAGCHIGISGGLAPMAKTLQPDPATTGQVLLNRPGRRSRRGSILEVGGFGSTVTDWVISGLEVSGAWGNGIDLQGTDRITIQKNHVHNNFGAGIVAASSNDDVIAGNETDHNWRDGIDQSGGSTNATIQGNKTHDNGGSGVQLGGGAGEGDGEDFGGGGRQASPVQNAAVIGNMIWGNGGFGGAGISGGGLQGSLISNNLLYNNQANGISLGGSGGSSNNKIYNNTVVMPPGSRYALSIPQGDRRSTPSTGNSVKNNILYTPETGRRSGSILIGSANLVNFQSDYNVVVNGFSGNNGRGVLTLAQWQALGYDGHSMLTPAQLFVDPANQNYQLVTSSPAVDAGTNLMPDVTTDILGVPRPAGGYDIGCYEVQQTTSGPPLAL